MDWIEILGVAAIVPWAVTVVTVAASPLFVVARQVRAKKSKKKNRIGVCGQCSETLHPNGDVRLFEGAYVCSACGDKLGVRLRRLLWTASGLALFAGIIGLVGMGANMIQPGGMEWWTWNRILVVNLPPFIIAGWTYRTVSRLKKANRTELREAREESERMSELLGSASIPVAYPASVAKTESIPVL